MNILFQLTGTCYMTWGKLWFSTPLVKSAKHGVESITFVGPKVWDIVHGFYIVIDSLEVLLSFSAGQNHTEETGYFNIPIPDTLIFLTKYANIRTFLTPWYTHLEDLQNEWTIKENERNITEKYPWLIERQ